MQNEQFADGSMRPLDMQSIDTGMGLERIGALLQGKHDNYDTDLMRALIEASAHATHSDPDGPGKTHHRVIADHLRAVSFLIADGVMPSNEGRGYVLRRIMRRAMRHAHLLGTKDPVMFRLVPALVQQMGAAYPELGRAKSLIEQTLQAEETRFKTTLDRGLKLLDDELAGLANGADLPGAAAFKLYDTFGFPLDLTQDALREKGRAVDLGGFEAAMAAQKAKARAAWSGLGDAADATVWYDLAEKHGVTEFLGYDTQTAEGQVLAVVPAGQQVQIVLNQTPFYAESGGQVGDTGTLRTATGLARVVDTRKAAGVFIHLAELVEGQILPGQGAELVVDHARRAAVQASHSVTHLLNEALRRTLGDHVAQRGSLNAPDRLRFDFSHGKGLTVSEINAVQAEVNVMLRQNTAVETRLMTPDDARALGAQALFGEKYGDEVRVVSMGKWPGSGKGADRATYSLELCGGTHVARTGDIGAFAIVQDSASSAGVRRIEALTGQAALEWLQAQADQLHILMAQLKAPDFETAKAKQAALIAENRSLAQELAQLKRDMAMAGGTGAAPTQAKQINGIAFKAQVLSGVSGKDLPGLVDAVKAQIGSGAVLLLTHSDGKAAVAAGVTADLTAQLSAVDILKAVVSALGGKGSGGRPDLAQGGAASLDQADAAIAAAEAVIAGLT